MTHRSRIRFFVLAAMLGASAMLSPWASAQTSYPQRSVKLVVPFPPGSGSDVAARVLAQH